MTRDYYNEMRERALAACEDGEGRQSEVARRLQNWRAHALGLATRSHARSGDARRGRDAGALRQVGGEDATLDALVAERNDATLDEYDERLDERTGVRRSRSACDGR